MRAKGAYGLDWLTVEKVQTRNFDQIALKSYNPKPLQPDECQSGSSIYSLVAILNSIPNPGQRLPKET